MRPSNLATAGLSLLLAGVAVAADSPEVASQKREMAQVFRAVHTLGVCNIHAAFSSWQESKWPDGMAARQKLLRENILPIYATAEQMKNLAPDQLESGYGKLCDQVRAQYRDALKGLDAMPATGEAAAQMAQLRESLSKAVFAGECQTASLLSLQAERELQRAAEPFMVDQVFGKDERYRQTAGKMPGSGDQDEVQEYADKVAQDIMRVDQYWEDCDAARLMLDEIAAQLQVVP